MAPSHTSRSNRLLRLASIVCVLLALVGYSAVLWLPLVERKNFHDENALLAGSAASTIRRAGFAPLDHVLHRMQQEQVTAQLPRWVPELMDSLSTPVDWTLQTFTQDVDGLQTKCTNFHAVLRAPTTDGTDSILLVTPVGYNASSPGAFKQTPEATNVALVLGAALVTHLSTVKWLARDIIWLVPDGRCGLLGSVQSWVDTYRLQAAGWDDSSFHRGGLIRQAVVLEIPNHSYNAAELSVEGFDGRLPNLDLYWTLTYLASHAMSPIPIRLQSNPVLDRWLSRQNLQWETRQRALSSLTLLQFAWRQAKGTPTGAHAPLLGAGVDAVTLRLIRYGAHKPTQVPLSQLRPDMERLLDTIEGTIRACNNLLESLHHSYKLYLQSSLGHFISIDMYIIPFTALFLVLIIQMVLLHVKLSRSSSPPTPSSWLQGMGRIGVMHAVCAVVGLLSRSLPSLSQYSTHINSVNASTALNLRQLIDLGKKLVSTFLAHSKDVIGSGRAEDGMQAEKAGSEQYAVQVAGAIVLVAGGLIAELLWAMKEQAGAKSKVKSTETEGLDWRVLKVLLLCATAMGCGTVACINWSLALMVAGLLLPTVLGTIPIRCRRQAGRPSVKPLRLAWMGFISLLSSPVLVIVLGSLITADSIPQSWLDLVGLVKQGLEQWEWSTLTCMVAWGLYTPVWLLSTWLSVTSVEVL